MGLNPTSATSWLCDLEHAPGPLCLTSSTGRGEDIYDPNNNVMTGLRIKCKHSEILAAIIVAILKLSKSVSCLSNRLFPLEGSSLFLCTVLRA